MMPTEVAELEWKTETAEIKEWTETKDIPTSWEEPRAESAVNVRIGQPTIDAALNEAIEQAKRILVLEDDWDGEGGARYSQRTFKTAIAFLITHMRRIWESYGIRLPVPRISPGPDGSIDLHWKQSSWELLVNISANNNDAATFYGDDYGVQRIRGTLNPNGFNLGIAEWLMK